MTSFFDILKAGYSKDKKNKNSRKLENEGYIIDKKLSDHNNKIYYNPNNKKLVHNVVGSHTLHDWVDNAKIAVGYGFKESNRYKTSHKKLRQAKEKYNIDNATVVGHSQGGYTAGMISGKNDKVITLNKAATIGQKVRNNETHYRTNDLVSTLNANSKHTVNLKPDVKQTGIKAVDAYNNHLVDAIKNKNIFI
jgi:hypothetical protein